MNLKNLNQAMFLLILKNNFDSLRVKNISYKHTNHLAAMKAPMIVRTTNQKAKFKKAS